MQMINQHPSFSKLTRFNKRMEASYDKSVADTYRRNDQRDITTPASRQVISHLKYLSRLYPEKINVLDVGCGTGRFFHALENVNELTGIDLSEPMLISAKNPVNGDQLDVEDIKLLRSDYLSADLPQQSFDLIYAIGVFGHPAPINKQVLDHFYRHLAPGGSLFFTIANRDDSKFKKMLRKGRLRLFTESIYDFLPNKIQGFLNTRWQQFFVSQKEMDDIFETSQFQQYCTWPMVSRFIACEARKP